MSSLAKGSLVLLALVLVLPACDALTSPQHRLARARTELTSGQWGLAAAELRKLVQADDHNGAAWLLLAELSLDVGDGSAAQTDLDHAQAAGTRGPELDALRARALLATGRPQALIDAVAQRQLAGLQDPERSVDLARAYNALRQPERAQGVLDTLLAAHPEASEARLEQARTLVLEGKSQPALIAIDDVLARAPRSSSASALRGQLLAQRGQFAAAESAFVQAYQGMAVTTVLPERLEVLAGLTEARLAQGKIDLAAQSESVMAKLAASAPGTRLMAARVKLARGDSLGGIADLQSVVASVPTFAQAQMLLGAAELQQGNLGQAQESLQQVVQLSPDNVQARELLASVRLKLNQPDAALRTLTPALITQAPDARLLSLLGEAEKDLGTSNTVLEALERALQAHPQDRTVRLNLVEAYLGAGRGQEALSLIQGTPELAGDLRRSRLLVTAVKQVRGPAAATAEVEKLLASHPDDAPTLTLAAAYFAAEEELGRARELLQQALKLNPHDLSTLIALAQVEAAAGDIPAAENSLRSALAADSKSMPVRIALADLLIQRKALSDAGALLAPISGPQAEPPVQFALARLALAGGDLKRANAALDQAIAQQPRSAELLNQAGVILMRANQYDAALARFAKATELSADNPVYWLNMGRAQLALNESPPARESFEKAAQLQPQWLPAVSALILGDLREKNYDSALARVRQLLTRHPSDADVLALEGDVEWAAGQLDQAAAAYAQAQQHHSTAEVAAKLFQVRLAARTRNPEQPLLQRLTEQPSDRSVRDVLGDYYLAQHEVKKAAVEYETVLRQIPTDLTALNNLAWCYQELRDPRAESLAERAYQVAPQVPNVQDTLGWILTRDGKTERALPLLAQAAKLAPANPNVQYHYAYVLAQQGNRAEAHKILSSLLDGKAEFESRRDAERLLADTKT